MASLRILVDSTVRDLTHNMKCVILTCVNTVAITRVQALLIVVGDPTVLSLDPLWRSFLNFVYTGGGWRGPSPTWDTTTEVSGRGGFDREIRDAALADMNDFTKRMEYLTLDAVDGNQYVDDMDVNVDRPWRIVE